MRMMVVTNTRMLSLGIMAKDIFINTVLVADEDGKSFDTVQIVKEDTLDKVKNLPISGCLQEIKDGAIAAFEEMDIGTKFLCVDDWIIDFKSDRAKFYWKVQELINNGLELSDAVKESNAWLKSSHSNLVSNEE